MRIGRHYTMPKHSKWIKIKYYDSPHFKSLVSPLLLRISHWPFLLWKPPTPLLCFHVAPLWRTSSLLLFSWSQDLFPASSLGCNSFTHHCSSMPCPKTSLFIPKADYQGIFLNRIIFLLGRENLATPLTGRINLRQS